MSKPLKVGLVGIGAIATCHAGAYEATGALEIAALCDIDEKRLAAAGERLGVADLYTDYRKLIAEADVDAVGVTTPNYLHAPITIAALAAGKHVFCEKPMATTVADARRMVAAAGRQARGKGKVLQIGMAMRQQPDAVTIKRLVDTGKLGEIYHIRAVMIRRRGIPGLGGWFTTMAASGGGPVMDLGVHWLDMAMHLSDNWQPTTVSAAAHTKFGRAMKGYIFEGMWSGPPKYDGTFDVEDYTAGLVRFAGGMSLTYDICWAANAPDEMFVQLMGDKGGASVTLADRVVLHTQSRRKLKDVPQKLASTEERFCRQAKLFAAACRGKGPVPATPEQGLAVMRQVLDAINHSARTGAEVKVRD